MLSDLHQALASIDQKGLRRRRRTLDSAQTAHVVVDGKPYVAFCSNDYLGLANHPELIAAAQAGAAQYGVGAGASHLVLGHTRAHEQLEEQLAAFVHLPRALLFSTGYMANMGVVTALVGREDAVFADRLNHASLNDACLLARAQFKRYAHNDLAQLERLLVATPARRKLIVADAVFSMDGDLAPVPELLALAERYDAWLMLDDAHGFGVLGANGRGVLEHFGLHNSRVIYMATLGKAAGVFGAFVAGEAVLIETLMQCARTYIYTTAMPPMLACAVSRSLLLMAAGGVLRARLSENISQLKQLVTESSVCAAQLTPSLIPSPSPGGRREISGSPAKSIARAGMNPSPSGRGAGVREGFELPILVKLLDHWHLLPSQTAIQPLIIGNNAEAVNVANKLAERGVLVPAIRPPTVPQGTARLRISLSAAHTPDDVRVLCDALADVCKEAA